MGFGGRKVRLEVAYLDTVSIVGTFPVAGPSRASCPAAFLVEGMGMDRVGIRWRLLLRLLPVLHSVAFLETAVGVSLLPLEDEKDMLRRENLYNMAVAVDPAFLAVVAVDSAFLAEIP